MYVYNNQIAGNKGLEAGACLVAHASLFWQLDVFVGLLDSYAVSKGSEAN